MDDFHVYISRPFVPKNSTATSPIHPMPYLVSNSRQSIDAMPIIINPAQIITKRHQHKTLDIKTGYLQTSTVTPKKVPMAKRKLGFGRGDYENGKSKMKRKLEKELQ